MFDNDMNDMPSRSDEPSSSVSGYLNSAEQAAEQGNLMLALHLYLAAFERGQAAEGAVPSEAAIAGLKRAWRLACTLKERSIAEYVFERMEPYLSSDEVAACADQLQELALAKLEEFGLSRDELEDMTDMISQDMDGRGADPRVRAWNTSWLRACRRRRQARRRRGCKCPWPRQPAWMPRGSGPWPAAGAV